MLFDYFAGVDDADVVRACRRQLIPNEGPSLPNDGLAYHRIDAPINWSAQPTPTHVLRWHEGGMAWGQTETLSAIKERKRAEITAARLAADADHFVYQGVRIRTADKDMFDLLVADARISKGAGMPPNWPGGWLGMNGIVYISSKAEWDPFFIAMYDTGMENFMRSQQIKAQIDNAATPAAIETITW